MPQRPLNTLHNLEPSVRTKISAFVQKKVRFESLAFKRMPFETSLGIDDQKFEFDASNDEIGIGYEMDVVDPPISNATVEAKEIDTPILFSNYKFSARDWRTIPKSAHNIQSRLGQQISEIALRADLITYLGDTKHGLNSIETDATEITTQLDVSTTALAAASFALAFNQLDTAMKFNAMVAEDATIIVEMTPDIFSIAQGEKSVNEDFNVIRAIQQQLKESYPNGNSRVVKNQYLGGSVDVNSDGIHTITIGTDTILIYIQHPSIMKILDSRVVINLSPFDATKGITVQPTKRHTRFTPEVLGLLVESDVKIA